MVRKEEWAMIVDWTLQNKYFFGRFCHDMNEKVQLVVQFIETK